MTTSDETLRDDMLDAMALAWLITKSTDSLVVSASLQAIAGLRRDFSATCVLLDAQALCLIEQGFQSCFHKDTTVDLQWRLIDAESAELYCRAWIKLTRGTPAQWPIEVLEPLWLLQDLDSHPDLAATASCAVALSSLDSHMCQWELLAYLGKCAAGELVLAHATQCCVLDSIIECLANWEMPMAVIDKTNVRAVPILLRMLRVSENFPASNIRSAVALALYVLTCGAIALDEFLSEEARRSQYCEFMLKALSTLVEEPDRFGIKGSLFDIIIQELSRLASPVIVQAERFPQNLRDIARSSLSKLYVEGRAGVGHIPDAVLADVLQLMFPPLHLPDGERTHLVATLVDTLQMSSHPEVTNWSLRLLAVLLFRCSPAVCQSFTSNNGIEAVLRAVKTGDVDSRRQQTDSFRLLFSFIESAIAWPIESAPLSLVKSASDEQLDAIFQSEFFEILCSFVASLRRLFEFSNHWMRVLAALCAARPREHVWSKFVNVGRAFVERSEEEDGYSEKLYNLELIAKIAGEAEDDG